MPVDASGRDGGGNRIHQVVDEMRGITGPGTDGLIVKVAGPAGLLADLIAVFSSIDGPLLLVTLVVVLIILLIVYRSPVLWIIPLLAAGVSYVVATLAVYVLADNDVIKLNGQAQGILTVLVFGAGTDYALLLDRPLPGGTAPPSPYARRDDRRLARRRTGHLRLRQHGHRRPALPAAVRPQLQPGARPGHRGRRRRHPDRHAHLPAGAAAARRPVGVLAPDPARRQRPTDPADSGVRSARSSAAAPG